MASEESLAFWPDGASGIKCLQFNTSKVDNFPGSYGDKAVVNAAAGDREFRYDPQFVAWFMEREQVQAVDKNLTAFKKPKRADNDVPLLSPIGHRTCSNGDIRLTFAVFGHFRLSNGHCPCNDASGAGRLLWPLQFDDRGHSSSRHHGKVRYSAEISMPIDFRPSAKATTFVVPVPVNGSRTVPPSGQVASIGILHRSSG